MMTPAARYLSKLLIIAAAPLGGEGRTGPLLTKTLLFLGQGPRNGNATPTLTAYDKATGDIVGQIELPAIPSARQ